MLLPIVTAAAIFAMLSLPGWILAADRPRSLWFLVAAGFCSQCGIILLTAAIALASQMQLDVRLALVVAAILSVAALLMRRKAGWAKPQQVDVWLIVVPLLATLTAAYITHSAITVTDQGLLVRSWFNADGFKHLGHVQALLAMGLPARDIFGAGEALAYYWLYYIVPASGAAFHGDAAGALVASGLVQTFAFWIVVQGLLRSAGANARWSAGLAFVAWLSPTPDGLLALASTGWDFAATASEVNVEGIGGGLLNASTLFRLSLYIPQHQMMLAGLLSWAILSIARPQDVPRSLRVLAVAPLVAAGAISTLFGAVCLCVFGVFRLLDTRIGLAWRVGGIVIVGILALAVPLLLGIVDASGGSGLDSPIFSSVRERPAAPIRLAGAVLGLVLAFGVSLIGLAGLRRGLADRHLSEDRRATLLLAASLVTVGVVILLAMALLDNPRIGLEVQLRASLLPQIGLVLGVAFLLDGTARQALPPIWVAVGTPLLILGMATPVLDTVWHGASSEQWSVAVPADDLAVLEALRRQSSENAVVLQYPELPFLSGGRDIWAAIFGGRTVYASHRSTHFGEQVAQLDDALAYFAGTGPLPEGDYGYVYLSRALHPDSYDMLAESLRSAGWMPQDCRIDACIWQRN